jgi:hypothetical protein
MTRAHIYILQSLVDGRNPFTGEKIPWLWLHRQEQILDAFKEILNGEEQGNGVFQPWESFKEKGSPSRRGEPWGRQEEKALLAAYKSGVSVKELALIHGRNVGGIKSRLEKLGMKQEMDAHVDMPTGIAESEYHI